MITAFLALRGQGSRIARIGIIAVLIAALLDQLEGVMLFRIMDDLPGTQATIDWLIPFVRGKFALLGLAAVGIGWLVAAKGRLWILAGLIIAAGGIMMIVGTVSDGQARFLASGGAISWTLLFVLALAMLWMTRRARPAS